MIDGRDAHAAYKAGVEHGIQKGRCNVERKDRVMIAYIVGVILALTVFLSVLAYGNTQKRKSTPLPVNKIEKSMERYYSGGFKSEK